MAVPDSNFRFYAWFQDLLGKMSVHEGQAARSVSQNDDLGQSQDGFANWGFTERNSRTAFLISGGLRALRLYMVIPKRRIGWSSGRRRGTLPAAFSVCSVKFVARFFSFAR